MERASNAIGSHDRRRVPPELDLSEIAGIEPGDPAGDVLERLSTRFAGRADRGTEGARDRISLGPAGHRKRFVGRTRGGSLEVSPMPSTEHVPCQLLVLGIDRGGSSMGTTGWVLLSNADGKRVVADANLLTKASVGEAEHKLADLISKRAPAMVAVDAPLTLPPCLTCPSYCRGPSPDGCELTAARDVWQVGGNPMTERFCEVALRKELKTIPPRPQATMRLGQIAARGVALSRRLAALRHDPTHRVPAHVIEIYPYASQHRLAATEPRVRPQEEDETHQTYAERVLDGIEQLGVDLGPHRPQLAREHVLDALLAAHTGSLAWGGLESPPDGFNLAAGWIWFPRLAM